MAPPSGTVAAFYDCLVHTEGSGVTLVVWLQPLRCHNQMPRIRRIGYRCTVAISSPIVQMTADMPISDINIGLTLVHDRLSFDSWCHPVLSNAYVHMFYFPLYHVIILFFSCYEHWAAMHWKVLQINTQFSLVGTQMTTMMTILEKRESLPRQAVL